MGLDTYIYKVDSDKAYDMRTKSVVNTFNETKEIGYFRKNYPLMEWFDKQLGFSMENCQNYIFYKEHLTALLNDCQKAMQLLCNKETQKSVFELFPRKTWLANETIIDNDVFYTELYDDLEYIYKSLPHEIDDDCFFIIWSWW